MIKLAIFCVALCAATVSSSPSGIQKLSSSRILNGSQLYEVSAYSGYLYYSFAISKVSPPGDELFRKMSASSAPDWRYMTSSPEGVTYDINVLADDRVVFYYSLQAEVKSGSPAWWTIGASTFYQLYPGQDRHNYYMDLDMPLLSSSDKRFRYNLTEPSLMDTGDGRPLLFYSNGTTILSTFFRDGIYFDGDSYNYLPASLDWEGGAISSPRAFAHEGLYYVMYTAADGASVGVARSRLPGGPYEKHPQPVGKLRGQRSNIRAVHKDEIRWSEDGWPYLA